MKKLFSLLALLVFSSVLAQDCDAGFKPIQHDLGTSCVPETIGRVVSLENSMTEAVLTLGVQPVGVADVDLFNTLVKLPISLSESVVDVGSRREPNLELIASLQPDLIIAATFRVANNYDALNAIAPTLAFQGSENISIMRDYFTSIAVALGREAEAQSVLNDMEASFNAATRLVEEYMSIHKGFVLSQTWYEDDLASFRLFTDNAMPVEILERIGLENSWEAEPHPDGFTLVGIEALGDIRDTNFLYLTDPDSASFYIESPLWNSLNFVQDGKAYRLNDELWLFGGPISAVRFVDAVLNTLGLSRTSSTCNGRLFASDFIIAREVCVPERATRIVVLDPFYNLQMGIELGLPIVGSATSGASFPATLTEEQIVGITDIGQFDSPNLEVLTGLNPDLILADAYFHEINLDTLNAIAPTVLINTPDWKQYFKVIAGAAGASQSAEAAFKAYEERAAALKDRLNDQTLSVVRMVPGQFQVYVDGPSSYAPFSVLQDAGVLRPAFETVTDDTVLKRLDWEGLKDISGDVLFYIVAGGHDTPEGLDLEAEVTSNSIWQTLPAVQAGRVFRVSTEHWMSFGGLASANAVLDDLERYLTGE